MTQQEENPYPDPRSPESGVVISFESGSALITLSGEIDLAMQPGLEFVAEEAIIRALPVRVDLSRVTYMDSAGVAMIATLVRAGAGAESGRRLTIVGPSRLILDVLALSGLLPALDVHQAPIQAPT